MQKLLKMAEAINQRSRKGLLSALFSLLRRVGGCCVHCGRKSESSTLDGGSWDSGSWDGGSWDGGSWVGESWDGGSWDGGSWDGWDEDTWDDVSSNEESEAEQPYKDGYPITEDVLDQIFRLQSRRLNDQRCVLPVRDLESRFEFHDVSELPAPEPLASDFESRFEFHNVSELPAPEPLSSDFESRFEFHDVSELPAPEPMSHKGNKTFPSKKPKNAVLRVLRRLWPRK